MFLLFGFAVPVAVLATFCGQFITADLFSFGTQSYRTAVEILIVMAVMAAVIYFPCRELFHQGAERGLSMYFLIGVLAVSFCSFFDLIAYYVLLAVLIGPLFISLIVIVLRLSTDGSDAILNN